MRTLGNIIWNFPFLGFVTAAIVFLIGLLFVVTIIAAPIGLGLIQYSKFLLLPFSYDMVSKSELEGEADKNILWQTYGFILKSVYIIFLSIPMAIVTLIQIIGCFCKRYRYSGCDCHGEIAWHAASACRKSLRRSFRGTSTIGGAGKESASVYEQQSLMPMFL